MKDEKRYSLNELFLLGEEYYRTHPENDGREHVDTNFPAQTYHEGVVDFLQWLEHEKMFLYAQETFEDIDDDDLAWMCSVGATTPVTTRLWLDQEEEENLQRDETY